MHNFKRDNWLNAIDKADNALSHASKRKAQEPRVDNTAPVAFRVLTGVVNGVFQFETVVERVPMAACGKVEAPRTQDAKTVGGILGADNIIRPAHVCATCKNDPCDCHVARVLTPDDAESRNQRLAERGMAMAQPEFDPMRQMTPMVRGVGFTMTYGSPATTPKGRAWLRSTESEVPVLPLSKSPAQFMAELRRSVGVSA